MAGSSIVILWPQAAATTALPHNNPTATGYERYRIEAVYGSYPFPGSMSQAGYFGGAVDVLGVHSPADLIADDKIRFGLSASMAAFIAIFIPIITGLRLGARAFPGQPAFPCR